MLIETDHYAMSDRTMSDEMRTYRQALRDVPTQSWFPKKRNLARETIMDTEAKLEAHERECALRYQTITRQVGRPR